MVFVCTFQRFRIRREWYKQGCTGDRAVGPSSARTFAIAVFRQTG